MRKKKHIGSSFEDFLKEEGVFEETTTQAVKRVLAWQVSETMKKKGITKIEMSRSVGGKPECKEEGSQAPSPVGGQFELLSSAEDLTAYRFHTGTAKHTFCRHCGIHPFYVPRSDPDKIDVNARCLDNVDLAQLRPHFFDGRNWEEAMAATPPWR